MDNNIKKIKTELDGEIVLKLFKLRGLNETHSDVIKRILDMKPPIQDDKHKIKVVLDEEIHNRMYKEFKKAGQTHSDVIKEQLTKYIKTYKKQLIKQLIN